MASAVLILVPYVLLHITNNVHSASRSIEELMNEHGEQAPTFLPRVATPCLLSTCALTSGTLMLMGGASKVRRLIGRQDEQKPAGAGHKRTASFTGLHVGSMTALRVRQVAGRLLGVGLPFYATLQLGSGRVGLVMLTALVADIANTDNEPRDLLTKSGVKRLLSSRRWTLGAMLLQFLCDIAGLTIALSLSRNILGYLALGLCVFALPPPFPSVAAKKAYVSSPDEHPLPSGSNILATLKEIPSAAQKILPPDTRVSLLVHTPEDVDLTLAVGAALGLLTSFIYFFMIPTSSGFSLFSLIGGISAVGTTALALTMARPHSLRQSKGVGLGLGSLLTNSVLMLFGPASWISFAYQAFLIGVSFAAVVYDTRRWVSISSHHHSHEHSHGHDHHHQEKKPSDQHAHPSRISRYLIEKSRGWPLLHSILVEKDSRRIFYFMMWVFHLTHVLIPS